MITLPFLGMSQSLFLIAPMSKSLDLEYHLIGADGQKTMHLQQSTQLFRSVWHLQTTLLPHQMQPVRCSFVCQKIIHTLLDLQKISQLNVSHLLTHRTFNSDTMSNGDRNSSSDRFYHQPPPAQLHPLLICLDVQRVCHLTGQTFAKNWILEMATDWQVENPL